MHLKLDGNCAQTTPEWYVCSSNTRLWNWFDKSWKPGDFELVD